MILPDLRGVSIPKAQGLGGRGCARDAGEVRGEVIHEGAGGGELAAEHQGEVDELRMLIEYGFAA